MGAALVGLGVLLLALTFLLAFTIYGELSGAVGLFCVAAGALILGRRSPGRPWKP